MTNRDPAALALINADLAPCLRIEGERIESVGMSPRASDRVVDLRGDRLLPGLINAHDHLQLNNYPRTRFRERHSNTSEWIEDIDTRRRSDTALVACAAAPRNARLLQGGLKNLLCGATTVAHHDPCYPALLGADFPVRVLHEFGWAHSLYIDGDAGIRASLAATPAGRPWIVHAGEGIDATARGEFARLAALGAIRAGSILVHGVAFDAQQLDQLAAAGGALVWCPGSNLFLFGQTCDVTVLLRAGAVLLGSDSRLSGERDLLAELALAAENAELGEARLTRMVTEDAARMLCPDRGALRPGLLGDCVILPRGRELGSVRRADLRAVIVGGELRYADGDYVAAFDAGAQMTPIVVDGSRKYLSRTLAATLLEHDVREPGCEILMDARWRAA